MRALPESARSFVISLNSCGSRVHSATVPGATSATVFGATSKEFSVGFLLVFAVAAPVAVLLAGGLPVTASLADAVVDVALAAPALPVTSVVPVAFRGWSASCMPSSVCRASAIFSRSGAYAVMRSGWVTLATSRDATGFNRRCCSILSLPGSPAVSGVNRAAASTAPAVFAVSAVAAVCGLGLFGVSCTRL